MIKLLEERLRQEVTLAASKLQGVGLTSHGDGVLLKFKEDMPREESDHIIGFLLSGYYSEKALEPPYSRLKNLHINFPPINKPDPGDTTYALMHEPPHNGKHALAGYRTQIVCFFDIRPSPSQPDWDYALTFSRRKNKFQSFRFHHDAKLSAQEATGFLQYVKGLLGADQPVAEAVMVP